MGVSNKLKILDEICKKNNLKYEEVAYIGDDLNDIPIIENVGFSCSVHNGISIIKSKVDYVTSKNGGEGAVREIADLILKYCE